MNPNIIHVVITHVNGIILLLLIGFPLLSGTACVYTRWNMGKETEGTRVSRTLALIPGVLLGIHLVTFMFGVWLLHHPPPGYFSLDPIPYDGIARGTVTWAIPGGFIGILCHGLLLTSRWRNTVFLRGLLAYTLLSCGFIGYVYFFLIQHLQWTIW